MVVRQAFVFKALKRCADPRAATVAERGSQRNQQGFRCGDQHAVRMNFLTTDNLIQDSAAGNCVRGRKEVAPVRDRLGPALRTHPRSVNESALPACVPPHQRTDGLRRAHLAIQQRHDSGGDRHFHAHTVRPLHHGAGAVHALGHVAE